MEERMQTEPEYQKGKENLRRLMRRAAAGEELVTAFFGGSITQGSLASSEETCYAADVFRWFEETFPKAHFHYVNAGIGGTSSLFGCARIREDLLMYHPDFVVVDFSVNDVDDDGNVQPYFQESYEAVIRRILLQDPETAVVLLNNIFYDTGISADTLHNAVGDHYGIPHVNIRESIYRRLQAGEFARPEISPDGLHPNDRGHRLVADEIIKLLEEAKKEAEATGEKETKAAAGEEKKTKKTAEVTAALPAPLTRNRYENAVRHTIANTDPVCSGFLADPAEKKGHLDFWKNGWIGRRTGDAVTFRVSCRCLAVQYRKTIQKPSPVAWLVIDGNTDRAIVLDGNFKETWGDCLYLEKVLDEEKVKEHEIRIEITESSPKDRCPFYLLSLITA